MTRAPRDLDAAIHQRWRLRLGIALGLMAAIAGTATALALGYGDSVVAPVFLWLGVGAVFLGWRSVPRGLGSEQRPAMRTSAAWVVVGVLCFFAGPLLVNALQG